MTEETQLQEIISLLDQYGLKTEVAILREREFDFNTVLRFLFSAYLNTSDDSFFTHFYRMTYQLFCGYATRQLKSEGLSTEPEEIVAETYGIILHRYSEMDLAEDERLLWLGYDTVRGLIESYRGDTENVSGEPAASSRHHNGALEFPNKTVQMEEDRRIGLLRSRIHELIGNNLSEFFGTEKQVLNEYFLNGRSVQEVAARLDTSVDNICEVLCRTRRKIQGLLMSSHRSLDTGEMEP